MSIEETIRTIVREELASFYARVLDPEIPYKPTAAAVHAVYGTPEAKLHPAVQKLKDEHIEEAKAVSVKTYDNIVVENTSELVDAIKLYCKDDTELAKRAKEVITEEGYDRFSLVPDEEAQHIYDSVIEALDA